jgi:hypothetical protein
VQIKDLSRKEELTGAVDSGEGDAGGRRDRGVSDLAGADAVVHGAAVQSAAGQSGHSSSHVWSTRRVAQVVLLCSKQVEKREGVSLLGDEPEEKEGGRYPQALSSRPHLCPTVISYLP